MTGDAGDVPVHVRRVVSASGAFESENEVHCLWRKASISVAECEQCSDYAGCEIDILHHRNYILCRRLTPETARALEPARQVILRRRNSGATSDAERTPVAAVMCCDVWCAREELPVAALRRLIADKDVGGIPVVDGTGRPVGMVTARDLAQSLDGALPAREIMSRLLFVLPDTASLAQAAALMALEHVHRIPIITEDGKLAGIVSSTDILAWLARHDGYVLPTR
jgi:CBS domain-containing protein